ncbi:MAG: macro domain-containing protein [Bacillota bacterium]|nr:macro domain-containing protein [Bacillota bacterium]
MPLKIISNDIIKVKADAIVNAVNPSLLGGGVDRSQYHASVSKLLEECHILEGCQVGQAKIIKGYNLPVKYIIHTVVPIWYGGESNEEKLLTDCYKNSFALAKDYKLESVAFPLISSNTFGYPNDISLKIAISVIGDFLLTNEMTVFLVVYDKASFVLSEKLSSSIKQYIDDRYIEEHPINCNDKFEEEYELNESHLDYFKDFSEEVPVSSRKCKRSLDDVIKHMDETFSQMLMRLIEDKGMTDAETYKKANIDRKLFSKIRNDINYRPSKSTVIAFAIALKLNLDETKDLLLKAGFALSHSSKFDIIIEYFIENKNYNIYEINDALFTFEQNLLGV